MLEVEQLKAAGDCYAAGRLAYAKGAPCTYGCHIGMRSTLIRDRAAFELGWHDAQAELAAHRRKAAAPSICAGA